MAPPTTKPRLRDLDPDAVGKAAHDTVLRHIVRLANRIGATMLDTGPSDLALTVADLTRYAQGLETGPHASAEALEAAQSICEALYSQPAGGPFGVGALAEGDDASLDEPIGVVLVAALARVAIADGQAVTARQLGALAGVDAAHVRLLARQGELVLDGTVEADEARRWLSGRGVPGFAT